MGTNFKILYAMFATMLRLNISDIAIITVKKVDYRYIIHNISKSEAFDLLKNCIFDDDCFYI